jgi:DNA end-binding protein Ku
LSSGQATVTPFSLRESSRVAPPRGVSARTRTPSHFTSWLQSGPAGTWVPGEASIGRTVRFCLYGGHMRAIWKGAVSFGLVSVPVKLYAATESHDVSFRQVHAKDGGRIKYQRVCSLDGEEVAYADIAKGYETEDGEMVILTDEDMDALPSVSSREIAVEKFVPAEQIDPMLFEKSYYLEPEKSGAKPYGLLRQALTDADRMAVVTIAIRNRTSVAVLRVKDDVIVLQTMMWPDEIRTPDFSVETGDVKPAEVKMAHMLVETLAGDFDPSEFEDDYAEAVETMVKIKIEGGDLKRTPTSTKTSGEVVDLLAALQRSVDAAKKGRGEETDSDGDDAEDEAEDEKPAKKTASKRTTTKKAAAKKAASKKTAAKKTTTKKAAAKKKAS